MNIDQMITIIVKDHCTGCDKTTPTRPSTLPMYLFYYSPPPITTYEDVCDKCFKKVDNTINKYLIPDLTNIIHEYMDFSYGIYTPEHKR